MSRFQCWTTKIHREFNRSGAFELCEYLPHLVGLACFKLEPYDKINEIKLALTSGDGMVITARWSRY